MNTHTHKDTHTEIYNSRANESNIIKLKFDSFNKQV